MPKKLLFHVPLSAPNNKPFFFLGALRRLAPYFGALSRREFSLHFWGPSRYSTLFQEHGFNVSAVPEHTIIDLGLNQDYQGRCYAGCEIVNASLRTLRAGTLDFVPDVVVGWETPLTPFAGEHSVLLHMMPSSTSRAPFAERLVIDPLGLFKDSSLLRVPAGEYLHSEIGSLAAKQERQAIDSLRTLKAISPYGDYITELRSRHAGGVFFLPLQNPSHFVYRHEFKDLSIFDIISHFHEVVPDDAAIAFTQYHTKEFPKVLSADDIEYAKQTFPKLSYNPIVEKSDSAAQYLWPLCDGVLNLSSTVGLQAWLHGANVYFHPNSHLRHLQHRSKCPELAVFAQQIWTRSIEELRSPALLSRLLASFVERRDANEVIDRYPEPADMVNGSLFVVEERVNQALRLLGHDVKKDGLPAEAAFIKLLQERKPKYVSFDIFDTLIERVADSPEGLFGLVEARLRELDRVYVGFSRARKNAERLAREEVRSSPETEVTLAQIYSKLREITPYSEAALSKAKSAEIAAETMVMRPRALGKRLFEHCLERGVAVCAISDMYLPIDVVKSCLASAGYPEMPVFLSSERLRRKHDGALYQVAADALGVSCQSILHVGDNQIGDYKRPKELGMDAQRVPSGHQMFNQHLAQAGKLLAGDSGLKSPYWTYICGLFQRRYLSSGDAKWQEGSLASGDPEKFGYLVLGPFLVAFCYWLQQLWTEKYRDRRILFLSRDGQILHSICSWLFPDMLASSAYIKASRASALLASINNEKDISAACRTRIATATVETLLREKFQLSDHEIDNSCPTLRVRVSVGEQNYEPLERAAAHHADAILRKAREHREAYAEYLASALQNHDGLVVDIGYVGSMQACIGALSGRKIAGAYFLTFPEARAVDQNVDRVHSWLGSFIERRHAHDVISRYGFVIETVVSSSEDSFRHFRLVNGIAVPVHRNDAHDAPGKKAVEAIHRGVCALASDLADVNDPLKLMGASDVASSQCLLKQFLTTPHPADALIFEGLVFEDAYGGSARRYLVPNRSMLKTQSSANIVWPEGHKAVLNRERHFNSRQSLRPEKWGMAKRTIALGGQLILAPFRSAYDKKRVRENPIDYYAKAKWPPNRFFGRLLLDKSQRPY